MKLKDVSKRLVSGVGVAVASTGLTNCSGGVGASVDPAPPPMECKSISGGESLFAVGRLNGSILTVEVTASDRSEPRWKEANAVDLRGVTLKNVDLPTSQPHLAVLTLELTGSGQDGGSDGGVTRGGFTLQGKLSDYRVTTCDVTRTFNFTLDGSAVQVSSLSDSLPLRVRHEATIGLLARSGTEVHLEARTLFGGARRVEWTATAGELLQQEGDRARWRLPAEPGLYQVALVVDYGDDGLAFDAMAFEVA